MELKGSSTEQNLKDAFAGESQANRRYLYFAAKGGRGRLQRCLGGFSLHGGRRDRACPRSPRVPGSVWRSGHGSADRRTSDNSKAAIAGETHEYTDMYPGMAKTARDEGFDEIADWFETLAKAERSHANRFQKALDGLDG